MTINEIITKAALTADDAADAAFELWQGNRPVDIHDNEGNDWQDKPVILEIDGQNIRLTANQADAIRAKIEFSLQEYGTKLAQVQAQKAADLIDENPWGAE
jgi:hypothetical protein